MSAYLTHDASSWCKSKESSIQNNILKYFDGIYTSSSEQILRGEQQLLQFLLAFSYHLIAHEYDFC